MGFRSGHSTSSALTTLIDDWLKSMELGKSVCSVFLDVPKAFDSAAVHHTTLVNKLQSHGLNVYLLRWMCDYLSGREQCVVLNGVTSRLQPVPSGVPQGSVLGPFRFTLYINDLADLQLSEGSKLVAYADDLLLYKPVDSNADYSRVQEDLTTIDHWMSRNSLTLNTTKCKQMVITRSRTHQYLQLYLASQPLECVKIYKYLGVIITSNLSWSDQI